MSLRVVTGDALRIARFEFLRHLRSRRFLLATFGLPVFVGLMASLSVWASHRSSEPELPWAVIDDSAWAAGIDVDSLSLEEAQAAMASGGLGGYVTLGDQGWATLWSPAEIDPPSNLSRALRERAREAVLAEAPIDRVAALDAPIELRHVALAAPDAPPRSANELMASLGLALGMPLVLVVTVLFSTSLLVTAVAEERAGRLLELLASSASPTALIAGKVLGLGAVGLAQTLVWLATVVAVLLVVAGAGAGAALASLWAPWVLVVAAYFVLGYLLFAAIMVAIGVWMGQPREAQQVAGIASLFLTLPFALMGLLLLRPTSPAARALSLLPPTAPAAMPMRLALLAAPPVEVALSLLGLGLTVLASFVLCGRVFAWSVLGKRRAGGGLRSRGRKLRRDPEGGQDQPASAVRTPRPTDARVGPATPSAGAPTPEGQAAFARDTGAARTAAQPGWRVLLLVAQHEGWTHLRRRSFLVTTFGLPLLGLLVTGFVAVAGASTARRAVSEVGGAFELDTLRRLSEAPRIGVFDPAGILDGEPAAPPEDEAERAARFRRVTSADEGIALLGTGELDRLYLLPEDYPAARVVVEWRPNLGPPEGAPVLESRLRKALWTEASREQLLDLARPSRRLNAQEVALEPDAVAAAAPEPAVGLDLEKDPLPALLVLGLGMLLYTAIFASSSFLLQSVTTEKENRVIELLLTSISPTLLLGGKILGLGVLGLLQLTVWTASGMLFSQGGMLALAAVAAIRVGPGIVLAGFAYFLFGYAFYAALMGAVGALVPSFQESGPLTFAVLFPAWTPFFFLEAILRSPDGRLSRILSLAPPTAPLVMMLRLAADAVPPWEVALGLALMAVGTLAVIWLAARVFHAGNLLSGSASGLRALVRQGLSKRRAAQS